MKKLICVLLTTIMFLIPTVALADAEQQTGNAEVAFGIDLGTRETPKIFDPENDLLIQKKTEEGKRILADGTRVLHSASVTVYPQIVAYYCGPASAYMVLKSWGVNVTSTTQSLSFFNGCPSNCPYPSTPHTCYQSYTSPQITLANSMGVSYAGADFIQLKTEINSRLPVNYYAYQYVNTSTQLKTALVVPLSSGHPDLIWVCANKLPRYSTTTFTGHYVVGYSYNTTTETVGIADPHYSPTYGGKYIVPLSTLLNAMYRSNGAANILW